MKVALSLGADEAKLREEMKDPSIAEAFSKTYDLANKLAITGTPSYVVGNEVVFGALGQRCWPKRSSRPKAAWPARRPADFRQFGQERRIRALFAATVASIEGRRAGRRRAESACFEDGLRPERSQFQHARQARAGHLWRQDAATIGKDCQKAGKELGLETDFRQSNHEGTSSTGSRRPAKGRRHRHQPGRLQATPRSRCMTRSARCSAAGRRSPPFEHSCA